MTVTLAVKSRDKIWFGADSRVLKDVAQRELYEAVYTPPELVISNTPEQKILPLQEYLRADKHKPIDAACTISGAVFTPPLNRLANSGYFDNISSGIANLMAFIAAGEKFENVPKIGCTYMLAGYDKERRPFVSKTQHGPQEPMQSVGNDWKPNFSQENFGLSINGMDSVITWVCNAKGNELRKLYREVKNYDYEDKDAKFVETFCREILDLKKRKLSWDDLKSNEVVRLMRGFLKLTVIFDSSLSIEHLLKESASIPQFGFCGPPYSLGYVKQHQGFTWKTKVK